MVRDIRQTQSRSLRRVVTALNGFNQRHPWSHNDWFHGWIMRNLPQERRSALEVGCGRGELARALANHFGQVRAIDPDAEMVRQAEGRLGGLRHVAVEQAAFLETDGTYDLVTMVAVLHHMDVEAALAHAREVLRPGGRLLVVGLSRMTSKRDLIWDTSSAVINPIVGFLKHPRVASPSTGVPFPTAEPVLSFDELDAIAAWLLPGARLRRRLFFRHTLTWQQPRDEPSASIG